MIVRHPIQALDDILENIAIVQKATSNKSIKNLSGDTVLRYVVERAIQIISEASRHLPHALTDEHPQINWDAIRGIGNELRHEYANIDIKIIWGVIENHLKPLKKACDDLRAKAADEQTYALETLAAPFKGMRDSRRTLRKGRKHQRGR